MAANLNTVIKAEVSRIAKKEIRQALKPFKAKINQLKKTIAEHQRTITSLASGKKAVSGGVAKMIPTASEEDLKKSRLSGGLIRKLRGKLKLSRQSLATLLGVNPNSVFQWERGKTSPRSSTRARIIQLRKLGRRELKKILATLKA